MSRRRELALLLRRLTVELDAVGQRFAELHGLNRTDVRALVAIMDAARGGESLTAGRLGAAVDLSSASVTALLDRLEKVGHIRRTRDADDRRRVVLEMSDSAMAAGAEHFGGLQRDLTAAMEGYTDEELAVVRRFLLDMTEVIERHARDVELLIEAWESEARRRWTPGRAYHHRRPASEVEAGRFLDALGGDGVHVALAQDDQVLAVHLDLVLVLGGEEHLVADLDLPHVRRRRPGPRPRPAAWPPGRSPGSGCRRWSAGRRPPCAAPPGGGRAAS